MDQTEQLRILIKQNQLLMSALKILKTINLPNWYIAGGAIRNLVFDYLHDYPMNTHLKDIDVVYFDSADISRETEKKYEERLLKLNSLIKWEVTNQANTHIYHPGFPILTSCEESFLFFSEKANCVGIKLNYNNEIEIFAPYGLDDLFNLIIRPVPKTPAYEIVLELYKKRLKSQQWEKTWPKLKVKNI